MRVRGLGPAEQNAIRECLQFVVASGELAGEFQTRLGVTEHEVKATLDAWPNVDDVQDRSSAALAINNAVNEVLHGIRVRDWDRWFTVTPGQIRAAFEAWTSHDG